MYSLLVLADFAFQLIIVMSLYQQLYVLPFDISNLTKALEMRKSSNTLFMLEVAVFCYLTAIVAIFVILIFKSAKETIFKDKHLLFKVFSTSIMLLRTGLGTAALFILDIGFDQFLGASIT